MAADKLAVRGDGIILAGQNPGPTFFMQNIDRLMVTKYYSYIRRGDD
jgi:hypothetical protein